MSFTPVKKLFKKIYLHRHFPSALFIFNVIIILWDALFGGYIFRLDMVFVPEVKFNIPAILDGTQSINSLVYKSVFWLFSLVLPMFVVQKLMLAGLLFLIQYAPYKAFDFFSKPARLIASSMYLFNPFVFDRFLAGHWLVLVGYALLPLVLVSSYKAIFNNGSIKTALFYWLIGAALSPHHVVIYGIAFLLGAVLLKNKTQLITYVKLGALALLVNAWWLLPLYFLGDASSQLASDDPQAFQAEPVRHGLVFTLLAMQGFWAETWTKFNQVLKVWNIVIIFWLVPVFAGLGLIYKENKRLFAALGLFLLSSTIIAMGFHPATYRLNDFLLNQIPGFTGLREPQKFVSLVIFVYAFSAGWAINKYKKASLFVLPAIVLFAYPLLFGFNNQLSTAYYPNEWQQLDALVQDNQKVLFLPFDQYLGKTHMGQYAANPAEAYFGERAITSRNPRMNGLVDRTENDYQNIAQALEARDVDSLLNELSRQNAKYIAIINTSNKSDYVWLWKSINSSVVISGSELTVYALTE